MSPLHVRSEVGMAPFHVGSKVCIAPIHVRSKVSQFAPHMDGSNAYFAPHMEGSHADFAPHMKWRHSFRDPKIAKITISSKFHKCFVQTNYIQGVYATYVTKIEDKIILRESPFKKCLQ